MHTCGPYTAGAHCDLLSVSYSFRFILGIFPLHRS